MIDDTRLMQLWHTGEAAASIARRTGERADSILARWRQLQRAGLVPKHARPPSTGRRRVIRCWRN